MDPDPGGPKTCGSGGSGTLEKMLCYLLEVFRQSREFDLSLKKNHWKSVLVIERYQCRYYYYFMTLTLQRILIRTTSKHQGLRLRTPNISFHIAQTIQFFKQNRFEIKLSENDACFCCYCSKSLNAILNRSTSLMAQKGRKREPDPDPQVVSGFAFYKKKSDPQHQLLHN